MRSAPHKSSPRGCDASQVGGHLRLAQPLHARAPTTISGYMGRSRSCQAQFSSMTHEPERGDHRRMIVQLDTPGLQTLGQVRNSSTAVRRSTFDRKPARRPARWWRRPYSSSATCGERRRCGGRILLVNRRRSPSSSTRPSVHPRDPDLHRPRSAGHRAGLRISSPAPSSQGVSVFTWKGYAACASRPRSTTLGCTSAPRRMPMLRHKLFSCNMLSSYVIERVCLGRVAELHAAPSGTRSVLNASLIPPAGELREAEQILEALRGLVFRTRSAGGN